MIKIFINLRSLCFCLRYLPFRQAIKVPILIGSKVDITKFKGTFELNVNTIKRGMVKLGLSKGSFNLGAGKSYLFGGDCPRTLI